MKGRLRLRRDRFARRLAKSRVSQSVWARRLGISKAYLSQLLNGRRRYPGSLLRRRMTEVLELSVEELFIEEIGKKVEPAARPSRASRDGLTGCTESAPLLEVSIRSLHLRLDKHPPERLQRGNLMDHVGRDLRYAFRGLMRNPAFSLVAVVTLALAVGANTTLFSAIETVLLTPGPYPRPEQVVRVWSSSPAQGWFRGAVSPQNAFDLAGQNRTLQGMGTYNLRNGNLSAEGRPSSIELALVTPSLLETLGVSPALGRLFDPRENHPGADGVALISSRLWSAAFHRDSGIVGRLVTLDGARLEVVGVMPDDFRFPTEQTDLWKPFGMGPDDGGDRGSSWVYAVGRLADGISIEQAQADLERVARNLEEAYPEANRDRCVFLEILHAARTRDVRGALLLLWGAVGMILLIACVNVASLLLARSASRRRELSVRSVLGAGPGRVLQQLMLECLLLATAATATGLLLSLGGNRLLIRLADGRLPGADQIGINTNVALFAAGLTVLTTLLFGLAPATNSLRLRLSDALRERSDSGAGARARLVLVAAQVCLALTLLTGSGLLLRSFQNLLSVDIGFDPVQLHTFRVEPPMRSSGVGLSMEEFLPVFRRERAAAAAFYDELQSELSAIAGVRRVGAINRRPLGGDMWQTRVAVEGRPVSGTEDLLPATGRNVTLSYFETMGIPLVRGRKLTEQDREGAPLAVVINRVMADAYWPDGDPIGSRITFMVPPPSDHFWMTVVGVVDNVRHDHLALDPAPVFYVPIEQAYFGFFGDWGMDVMLRVSGNAPGLAGQVAEVVQGLDPQLPISSFQSMQQVMGENASAQRFNLLALSLFAGLALALTFVGIYGVISYLVTQRKQEFGIRAALGARPADVLKLVALQSTGVTVAGIAGGVVATLLLSGWISDQLYQISPADPATMLATAGLMLAVGVAAGLVPAWRAGRADPLETLRSD